MGVQHSCNNCCIEKDLGTVGYGYIQSNSTIFDLVVDNHQTMPEPEFAKPVSLTIDMPPSVRKTYRLHRIKQIGLSDSIKSTHAKDTLNGSMMHLQPFYLFESNAYYEGEWQDALPHGQGRMQFDSGALYEGGFNRGLFESELALYIFPDGSYYKGSFFAGKAEGKGHLHNQEVDYTGQWLDNLPHGQGMEILSTGERYHGNYKFGEKHGQGSYIWEENCHYSGDFVHNMMTGRGRLQTCEAYYIGQFLDGKKHGNGKLTFYNGGTYIGNFEDDKRHGWGSFLFTDGTKYSGNFKYDYYHGQGRLELPSGQIYEGRWERGQKIKETPLGTEDIKEVD